MKHITRRLASAIALAAILVTQSFAEDSVTAQRRNAILKVAYDAKNAILAKDHEAFVGTLYPEMVKAAGGKERMIQMLKAEDVKNDAAGVVIESLEFAASDTIYTGSHFRLTFVTSTLIAKTPVVKMESKSFYVAFSPLIGEQWYLLDGTRMTIAQFRHMFRGFPADLQLPKVEKKTL